jgi:hypothetical protein
MRAETMTSGLLGRGSASVRNARDALHETDTTESGQPDEDDS